MSEPTSKHTPGPWSVTIGGYVRPDCYREPDGCVWTAICHCSSTGEHIPHLKREEQDANAQLIASAPDLLAACKFALEVLGRQTQFYREDAVLARLALDIEAAVAKAEGVKSSAESTVL